MQDKPRDSTVNAAVLARQTPGFSGAELSNLVNEAALLAAKTSKPSLSAELLDSARDKALMGVERRWAGFSHTSGTNQSTNQSINQSVSQSSNRSINQFPCPVFRTRQGSQQTMHGTTTYTSCT